MNDTADSVKQAIRTATEAGDVPRLRALANQFPDSFESLRDTDLVDRAVEHRQPGATLYLTLVHGFEVTPNFDRYHKQFGGDLFAEGVNEYQQTLEVMADAALNLAHAKGRSIACYAVRDFAADCANPARTPKPMHPEFLRALADGHVARFTEKYMRDERYERCQYRHTGSMLNELKWSHAPMQAYAQQLLRDAAPRGPGNGISR
jgi:hypothetical protein